MIVKIEFVFLPSGTFTIYALEQLLFIQNAKLLADLIEKDSEVYNGFKLSRCQKLVFSKKSSLKLVGKHIFMILHIKKWE